MASNDADLQHESSALIVGTIPASNMSDSEEEKINLSTLPEDVLRRILDFLLTAKYVKKWVEIVLPVPRGSRFTSIYDFQMAILRVNKSIHQIASGVFLANHFIMFNLMKRQPEKFRRNLRFQCWSSRGAKSLKYHRMEVTYSIVTSGPIDRRQLHEVDSYILCSDDLYSLVLHLRRVAASQNRSLDYVFDLKSLDSGQTMSVKQQIKLLDPFSRLTGAHQRCTVSGNVDEMLSQALVTAMTPRVVWFRARTYEWYHLIRDFKFAADAAFSARHGKRANALYGDALAVCSRLMWGDHYSNRREADDQVFWDNLYALILALHFNFAMLLLLQSHYGREPDPCCLLNRVLDLPAEYGSAYGSRACAVHYSGLMYCQAVAAVALNKRGPRETILRRIDDFEHFDERYDGGITLMKSYMRDHPDNGNPQELDKTIMVQLLNVLPKRPMQPHVNTNKSFGASIDLERYVLKSLGYSGTLYEGWIEQKEGYSVELGLNVYAEVPRAFDPDMGQLIVDRLEEMISRRGRGGQLPQVELLPFSSEQMRQAIFDPEGYAREEEQDW